MHSQAGACTTFSMTGGVPIERPEYHIRCNSSLHNTRNCIPTMHVRLSDDGTWPQALPANTYDAS